MKTFIFCFCTLFLFSYNIYSQFNNGAELFFYNESSQDVIVRIYPISGVFNNDHDDIPPVFYGNYNLVMTNRPQNDPHTKDFISGVSYNRNLDRLDKYFTIPPGYPNNSNAKISYGFDDAGGSDLGTAGTLGFGIWRVEFFWTCTDPEAIFEPPFCYPDDYFTIEYDFGYRNNNRVICGAQSGDVYFRFTNPNPDHKRIQYLWKTCECQWNTTYQDIPQNRTLYERERGCTGQSWPKELGPVGGFKYNNGRNQIAPNPYYLMPLDPRQHCTSQYFPQSYSTYENHFFQNGDIGKLILNLTVEKNIETPIYPWDYLLLEIPAITITNEATLKLTTGSNNQERTFRFKKYHDFNTSTPLYIDNYSVMELQGTDNINEISHVIFEDFGYGMIRQHGLLMMRKYSKFTLQQNSNLILKPISGVAQYEEAWIEVLNGSTLLDCGARYTVYGPKIHVDNNGSRWIISNTCPEDGIPAYESLVDSGGAVWLSNQGSISIDPGCKLTFDGSESYLKAEPGTSIILGEGASIEFRNGAYLDADGCTFTSSNSGEIWNGIVLDGAGSETNIRNCTFIDAASSIEVTNTVCSITGNTFNIGSNPSCIYGINAVNETNITIANNLFDASTSSTAECIKFFNYDGDGIPGGGGVPVYYLNVFNNTFNGGVYGLDIQCLTASQLPFYISYNSFIPAGGVTSNGIYAYNITGSIKNNTFLNAQSNKAFSLQFSSVNIYNNYLNSDYQDIWTANSSILQMSPLVNENGQPVWYGGYNKLISTNSQNIEFRSYSNPVIALNGNNCFYVNTQPNLMGEICLGSKPYNAKDNYWSPSVTSSTFDITCNNNPANVTYTPNLTECPEVDMNNFTGNYIHSIGNNMYDTVFISASGGTAGSQAGNVKKTTVSPDKLLYFEAIKKRNEKDYTGAINKCSELINNYDTSMFFNSALSELYLNYLNTDTSGNQAITNGLFNGLKTYLEQKMQQYQNNAQFVERAYKYLLMCLVKTKAYSEAVAGYENIMNNHPDPVVRLNASWDRSAVVFMMGQGGGESNFKINNNKSSNKKLLDKNPAHKIAEDVFKEQKRESDRLDKIVETNGKDNLNLNTSRYTKEEKQAFERRIERYNPIDKNEFMEKLSKDVKVMDEINKTKTDKKTLNNLPKSYKLYQNYPNPFNPTTSIKYEIPKNAEVTIKVYDLLGKEVFSLNEYRQAGSYEVKFDGSNLASGMYFYSLETIGFKDVKKMVLLK